MNNSDQLTKEAFCCKKYYTLFLILASGYFIFRMCYIAFSINHSIPPDEITHFGKVKIFSKSPFIPTDSPETYHLGLISHTPNFYYFLLGKLLHLNFFMDDLIFLRLLNVLMTFGGVVYGYFWLKLFVSNRLILGLFYIMTTNTLMYTFLGGAVSYDNLTNLFAIMSIYHLFAFIKSEKQVQLYLFILSVLFGALTKKTLLPLILIETIVLLFVKKDSIVQIVRTGMAFRKKVNISQILLLSVIAILSFSNIQLYGVNLFKYKKIIPRMDQVIGLEQALQYRIFARNWIVSEYKKGNVSYDEAVKKTSIIKHKGDRSGTLYLLHHTKRISLNPTPLKNRFYYFFSWCDIVFRGIYGIAAHGAMLQSPFDMSIYFCVWIFGLTILIRKWKFQKDWITYSVIIAGVYILVLMQYVNYRTYRHFEAILLALQGRYLFPVILPLYGLLSYHTVHYFSKKIQWLIVIVISINFMYGDFIFFLRNLNAGWFFK